MSIEKMRDDFELLIRKEIWGEAATTEKCLCLIRLQNGEYENFRVQSDWSIWKASRAAIEVELPQIVAYEAGYDSIRENEYASQSGELFDADEVFALCRSIEVIEAIESLGLKVKA